MYPNLKAEMARLGLSYADFAAAAGQSVSWVDNRLNGKAAMPANALMAFRDKYLKGCPLDYLLDADPQVFKG